MDPNQAVQGDVISMSDLRKAGFQVVKFEEIFPSDRWEAEVDLLVGSVGYGENRVGQKRVRKHLANFRAG